MDENYEMLISAILERALRDYRNAKKKLKRNPNNNEAKRLLRDVTSFFGSGYCAELTELNMNDLVKGLERVL